MNDNILTVTGVIATILSVIFAAAAIWNSRMRRSHLEELEEGEAADDVNGNIHFTPMPSSTPDSPPSSPSPPAPAAAESSNASAAKPALSQAVFRRVKPGLSTTQQVSPNEKGNLYVWE